MLIFGASQLVFFSKYNYNNQFEEDEMDRGRSTHEEKRSAYKVRRPEGKRPLGRRTRRSWEDNIKINLRKIGWSFMDCINLAHDRGQWRTLMNMVINFWVAERLMAYKQLGSMELVGSIYKTSDSKGKHRTSINRKA
jgi:hypothetical protein